MLQQGKWKGEGGEWLSWIVKHWWAATLFKLLLIPSYRSTDFEVHRNWLAITHSLPLSEWYYVDHSEWTLDYPPFFAWWEYFLSLFANFFDPEMLKITNLNYASPPTILFQRLSVITSDFIFFISVLKFTNCWFNNQTDKKKIIVAITFLNGGLLLVDHIHFQYNGLLFGILILSISFVASDNQLMGGILFAILLNFKHIFLYFAPVYFVYLLKTYCFSPQGIFQIKNFIVLGSSVILVFALSFGPFILSDILNPTSPNKNGQISQIVSRLFPFQRGLVHAYWAPNFWALYNFIDKVATVVLKPASAGKAQMTGGLVGVAIEHQVLPTITPLITFVATFGSMIPALYKLWRFPEKKRFIMTLVHCGLCSFYFGWHVHEKAILMVTIPLGLLSADEKKESSFFLFLSTVANYSLMPLLFTPAENPIKILIVVSYSIGSYWLLSNLDRKNKEFLFTTERLYLYNLIIVFIITDIILPNLNRLKHYEFLPLLITSVYCSVGVTYFWLKYYYSVLMLRSK